RPLRGELSQPANNGGLTSQCCRLPSDSRTNAPLRVPTSTRTPLILHSFLRLRPPSRAVSLYCRMGGSRSTPSEEEVARSQFNTKTQRRSLGRVPFVVWCLGGGERLSCRCRMDA